MLALQVVIASALDVLKDSEHLSPVGSELR